MMRPSAEFFGTFCRQKVQDITTIRKTLENRLKVNTAVKLNLYLYRPKNLQVNRTQLPCFWYFFKKVQKARFKITD